jgi:hypothetical protein
MKDLIFAKREDGRKASEKRKEKVKMRSHDLYNE